MKLLRWEFERVCTIEPRRDDSGVIVADLAHKRFANLDGLPLNAYGAGPFCRFSALAAPARSGVYAFVVNGGLEYIGECEDLSARVNNGYGNISPRNCFARGQSTNCRVNNAVFRAAAAGQSIELFFLETSDRFKVEAAIIAILKPKWNRKMIGRRPPLAPTQSVGNRVLTRTPVMSGNSCRDQVVTAARAIVAASGVNAFTLQEVVDYLRAARTVYKDSTIRTHVTSVCCRNAPVNRPAPQGDLERVSRGVYRLVS